MPGQRPVTARRPDRVAVVRDAARHDVTQTQIEPGPLLEQRPGSATRSPDLTLPAAVGVLLGALEGGALMVATRATETPVIDRAACPANRHGDRNARWTGGCTCDDAYRDSLRYKKLQRTGRLQCRKVSSVGVARRLQALAVIGWSGPAVALELGVAHQLVAKWRSGRTRVYRDTIRRVVAVYGRLHATPAPVTPGSGRARADAVAKLWAGPDEWIDIDDPAELPDSYYRRRADDPTATADLLELAALLRVDGRPDCDAIAARVGMSAEAVQRRLERHAGGRKQLADDDVYEIRDTYLRERGTTWSGRAAADRWGTSKFTISQIIHGRIRPELGLTDLTAHPGGHHTAATPTGGTHRKEINAA